MDGAFGIDGLDEATVTNVACQVLGQPDARLESCIISPLSGSWTTAAGGGGVYRAEGTARAAELETRWSAILKIADTPGDGANPYSTWERELRGYESGLLNDLPGGISAPHYYDGDQMPNGKVHLWLEDLADVVPATRWSLAEYAVAARALGAFNGSYLVDRPLPDARWLNRHGRGLDGPEILRPVAEWFFHAAECGELTYPTPDDIVFGVARVWRDLAVVTGSLHHLPMTFCHIDAFSRNLFSRFDRGNEHIVAIDWALAGIAPLGQDLVSFTRNTVLFEFASLAPTMDDLDRIAFPAYVVGLRDAGWIGDARLARLGFTAGIAFLAVQSLGAYRWGGSPGKLAAEKAIGLPFDQIVEKSVPWRRYSIRLADEARALVDDLGMR